MDPKPVQIGAPFEEFPGGSFNALVANDKNQRGQRQPPAPGNKGGHGPACIVQIKNNSGSDIGPGGVLGIDGPLFPYSDDPKQVYSRPVLKGITPTTAAHSTKFAILLEWITNGKLGAAVIPGATWAKVDVTSASHTHAKVKNSTRDNLESGTSGYEIIYKEKELLSGGSELGVQWAIVLVGAGAGGGCAGVPASRQLCATWHGTVMEDISGPLDPCTTEEGTVCLCGLGDTLVLNPHVLVSVPAGSWATVFQFGDGHFEIDTWTCPTGNDTESCDLGGEDPA